MSTYDPHDDHLQTPDDLDELVHDAKAAEAAAINNDGPEAQRDFLAGNPRRITLDFDLEEQFLKDVLVTICEGGLCSWAHCERVWDQTGEGLDRSYTKARIRYDHQDQPEGSRTESFTMTLDAVAQGFRNLLAPDFKIGDRIPIIAAIMEDDAGQIDANAADCIAQAVIFGELIYG